MEALRPWASGHTDAAAAAEEVTGHAEHAHSPLSRRGRGGRRAATATATATAIAAAAAAAATATASASAIATATAAAGRISGGGRRGGRVGRWNDRVASLGRLLEAGA